MIHTQGGLSTRIVYDIEEGPLYIPALDAITDDVNFIFGYEYEGVLVSTFVFLQPYMQERFLTKYVNTHYAELF